ncbi:putative disease resistance protein RGA4 [Vigna umbellata]|uniref:putative disease resistance protein RGA4 n=1 Tax=Vigna umbellata TaxID=87088 RepID=UPI001F5EACD9|nr:putative disease resistance protein RGA4 [Vigna umbellata]
MSIRTNKMKAVAVLLKQLMTARSKFDERGRDESFDRKLEKLRLDLNKIKDVFVRVKKNEEDLLDILAEVYGHLRKLDRGKLNQDMDDICQRIRDSAHNLLPKHAFDESSEKEDHKGGEIFPLPEESVQLQQKKRWTLEDFNLLDDSLKACLLSLSVFPENAVIRKRNAINLWIGKGLIKNTMEKTAENIGEDVIDDLLEFQVIVPYGSRKDALVKKFQILPDIRHGAFYPQIKVDRLELEQKRVKVGDRYFGHTIRTVFNIGSSYLNFKPQWVTDELKDLEVLQLGRWQDSALHHIEVGSEEFLKELRYLKKLKYLSLRGISNIFELPSSIGELESLIILDLKACHNLERLPNDISSMKSLTHLIMSDCCLLEGMPKGIEKLTNLQVLKGFLTTTSEKTPCTLSDLANNLTNLRRLSIRIGSEAMIRDGEFQSLKNFRKLKHLKISWSVSDPRYAEIPILWPVSLRKLHLECFPGKSLLEFLPGEEIFPEYLHIQSEYEILELNITGGKLENIFFHRIGRNVNILRLKYLKQLNVDIDDLKIFFPFLQYLEIKQISNHSYIECRYENFANFANFANSAYVLEVRP